MNPESIRRENNAEHEIDQRIESLKEAHPLITKEEYWESLKVAMSAYDKISVILSPLAIAEIGADPLDGKNDEGDRIEARAALIEMILDCDDRQRESLSRLSKAIDDRAYVFMPQQRPDFGEMDRFFGAEKLGIPRLLPNILVLPEESWKEAFPEAYEYDEQRERFCNETRGFNYPPECFNDGSQLAAVGLNIINGEDKSSELLEIARHESVHGVDFLGSKRRGIDKALTELIAYRIDQQLSSRKNKRQNNLIDLFLTKHFSDYLDDFVPDHGFKQSQINDFSAALKRMIDIAEKLHGFHSVTELLLNSVTLDEFTSAVNSEYDKSKSRALEV